MFERFNTLAMLAVVHAVLALYASGCITGMVVDLGGDVTHTVPICGGHALSHTISRLNLAGNELIDFLTRLLAKCIYSFGNTAEREMVRDMKEKLCFVTTDFEREAAMATWLSDIQQSHGLPKDCTRAAKAFIDSLVEKEGNGGLKTTSSYLSRLPNELLDRVAAMVSTASQQHQKSYELPDGQFITISHEQFHATEALFQPLLMCMESAGVHKLTCDSMMKCDVRIMNEMWRKVVLLGGNTMFPGMANHLRSELTKLAPPNINVKVIAPCEWKYSVWISGSILSFLSSFQSAWISKEEYDECGALVLP